MATYNDDCSKSYKFSVVTKNPYFDVEFDWQIENYFYNDGSPVLLSPEILLPGITWQFGLKNKYSGTRAFEIFIRSSSVRPLFISGRFSYGSRDFGVYESISKGDNAISKENLGLAKNFSACLRVYGLHKSSFFVNEIPNQSNKNHLVHNNDDFLYKKNILDKIKSMWQSQTSDVRIRVEEKTIHVHKFILLAMSPVLASMLPTTEENTHQDIEISDTPFEVMVLVVRCMYGFFPEDDEALDWDKLCDVYRASEKYQVLDLRDLCGRAMIKKLTIENAGQLLDISDRYKDDALMNQVAVFCCKNLKEVDETDWWKNWIAKNPMVASLLRCFADADV